jgi:hypothetical protein
MFSSPAIAGDVVYVGVTTEHSKPATARPARLLWDFQTEASKQNPGWVLTADRKVQQFAAVPLDLAGAGHRRDLSHVGASVRYFLRR